MLFLNKKITKFHIILLFIIFIIGFFIGNKLKELSKSEINDKILWYITWCTLVKDNEVIYDSWANLYLSLNTYSQDLSIYTNFSVSLIDRSNERDLDKLSDEEKLVFWLVDTFNWCQELERSMKNISLASWKQILIDKIENNCPKIKQNYLLIQKMCNSLEKNNLEKDILIKVNKLFNIENLKKACKNLNSQDSDKIVNSFTKTKSENLYIDFKWMPKNYELTQINFVWKWNSEFLPEFKRQSIWKREQCNFLLINGKKISSTCFSVFMPWEWVMTKDWINKAYILNKNWKKLIWKYVNNKFELFWYLAQNVSNPIISTSWKVLYLWTSHEMVSSTSWKIFISQTSDGMKRLYRDNYVTQISFEDILYYDFFPNSDDFFFVWKNWNKYTLVTCK